MGKTAEETMIVAGDEARDRGAGIPVTEKSSSRLSGAIEHAGLVAAVDQAADGIVVTDTRGRIQYVNPAFTRMTGYASDEVAGKPTSILKSGRQSAAFYRELWTTIQSGQVWHGELINCRKDGTHYQEEMQISPVRDPSGEIASYIAIKRDVTERRAAEEAQGFLAAIVEGSQEAIITFTPASIIHTWNRGAEAIFGYTAAEAIGKPVALLVAPERLAKLPRFTERLLQGACVRQYESVGMHRSGRKIQVSVTGTPIRNRAGIVVAVSLIIGDITERKQAEQALQFQHSLIRAIHEVSLDGILVIDTENRIRSHNKRFLDMWRMPVLSIPDNLPDYTVDGQPTLILSTALDRVKEPEAFLKRIQELNADPDAREHCEVDLKDGRTLERYSSSLRNEAGQHQGRVWFFRDITERKEAEQRLQRSEEKFRQLAENVREVFWMMDPSSHEILYVSPAYEQVWERACGNLYRDSMAWAEAIHPDDTDQAYAIFARQIQGEVLDSDYRIRTPRGREKWIRDRAFPVRDQAGQLIRIVGIAEEITEQKRYEAELIQANVALRNSEAQFRSLVEGAPDAIFVQVDYRFAYVNTAACCLFGAESPAQLVGQPIMDRFPLSMHDAILERIRKLLQEKEPTPMVEHTWLRLDGHPIPVEVTAVPVSYQGKDAALVFARDITERKNAESRTRQLEIMAAEAQAESRAKSLFLSIMSHEIRTPMNAILGYSQLMMRDPALGADAKENLKIIGRSGEHLLALINDVLDMSKIEAGRTELNPATFDLSRLLDDLAAMFHLRAGEKGIRFELLFDGEKIPCVVADEGKIRQVLINLLGNAVKFTKRGRITLHASLERRESDRLWLSGLVEDTGSGVAPEEQKKLFEPFSQTTRGLNTQGGTGLGLAISRKYARLMGGDLTFVSKAEAGSIFRFEIPIEQGDSKLAVTRTAPRRVSSLRRGQEPPKILIVDDYAENRDWLLKLLSSIGFSVRDADNGEAAIRSWEEWHPSLILMDVHMPVMDGLKATREIKSRTQGQKTIVVALTASAMEDDRRAVLQNGADDFLSKPCLEGELLEKLHTLLKVDYEYVEQSEKQESAGKALSSERLGKLPQDVIEEICDATSNGNKRRLDELFLKVSDTGDFESARGLQELADRYEYDALTRILKEASLSRPGPNKMTLEASL